MGTTTVRRDQALARYDAEFNRWRAALDAIGLDRMDEPGMMGEWSAKHLVAHVTGWQWKTLASFRAAISGGEYPATPWPAEFNDPSSWELDGDVESINQWIHDMAEPAPVETVIAYSVQQWQDIRAIISDLDERQITDPKLFPRLEGRSIGAVLTEGVFSEHTAEHLADDVEPWLARNGRRQPPRR